MVIAVAQSTVAQYRRAALLVQRTPTSRPRHRRGYRDVSASVIAVTFLAGSRVYHRRAEPQLFALLGRRRDLEDDGQLLFTVHPGQRTAPTHARDGQGRWGADGPPV